MSFYPYQQQPYQQEPPMIHHQQPPSSSAMDYTQFNGAGGSTPTIIGEVIVMVVMVVQPQVQVQWEMV